MHNEGLLRSLQLCVAQRQLYCSVDSRVSRRGISCRIVLYYLIAFYCCGAKFKIEDHLRLSFRLSLLKFVKGVEIAF